MAIVPFTNPGKVTVHIGGKAIKPGDTRDVEETMIPGREPAAEADPEPNDPIATLLAGKVPDIVAALPELDDADFVRLARLEQESDKPRKGLMAAITEEELRRAAAAADAGTGDEITGD